VATVLCGLWNRLRLKGMFSLKIHLHTKRSRMKEKWTVTLCSSEWKHKSCSSQLLFVSSWKCRFVIFLYFPRRKSRDKQSDISPYRYQQWSLTSISSREITMKIEHFMKISHKFWRAWQEQCSSETTKKNLLARKRKENWKSGRENVYDKFLWM
jgi:hypothetical protein